MGVHTRVAGKLPPRYRVGVSTFLSHPSWIQGLGMAALGLIALALLLALATTVTVAERFVLFPDRTPPGPPPALAGIQGQEVRPVTSDGITIHGWWYGAGPSAPAVLFLHGNAGTIAHRTPLAEGYLDRGISVLLLEYRGYGASGGRPSEVGVYRDAAAGLSWLGELGVPPARTVIHGRSLGGVVAVHAAAGAPGAFPTGNAHAFPPPKQAAAGLILESTFTSLDEMAAAAYPFLPRILLRRLQGRFDALSRLGEVDLPTLVIHGTEDRLVPPTMGRRLHEVTRRTGAAERLPSGGWYALDGADHNDGWWVGGAAYFSRLAAFVHDATEGRPGGVAGAAVEAPPHPEGW